MLSVVSWIALAVILAALVLAWTGRFLAVGSLAVANLVIYVMTDFGPHVTVGGTDAAVLHLELGLWGDNLYHARPMGFVQLVSSMFIHADFFHLFGNLIVLLAFALPFEERIGRRPFLLMYLGAGLIGALAQVGTHWGDPMLMMGASGAVFGIIGAFAAAYPRLVVPLPLPLVFIMVFVRMRVIIAALIFAVLQFLLLTWLDPLGGTAYMAHIGGLVGGIVLSLAYIRVRGLPQDRRRPVVLSVSTLAAFAQDPGTRQALEQMEKNRDAPEVFQAWWERFWQSARDPETGQRVRPGPPGKVVREDGTVLDIA